MGAWTAKRRIVAGVLAVALGGALAPPALAGHPPIHHGHNPSTAPTVEIAATPSGNGYFLMDSVGGISTHGDARFFGSVPGLRNAGANIGPAAAIDLSATTSGNGYWVLDAVGGMFSFGDASFFGSVPGLRNAGVNIGSAGVVDLAPTVDNGGYYLLDDVGGVFAFGNAAFFGSIPQLREQGHAIGPATVVAIVPVPGGGGYWMLDSKGGLFAFGRAPFHGSLPGIGVDAVAVGMAPTADGGGYWIVTKDGAVYSFGNAAYHGSANGKTGGAKVVGFAASPHGSGYWIALETGSVFAYPGGLGETATTCSGQQAPPANLQQNFYSRWCGEPLSVIAHSVVNPTALVRAEDMVAGMLAHRPDILEYLRSKGVYLALIGEHQDLNDLPEYRHLDDWWNQRARGLGGHGEASGGEENVLCLPSDRYRGAELILLHEFAHTVKSRVKEIDSSLQGRIDSVYNAAIAAGRWKDTYAATNSDEFWAEGVQSYFDSNAQASPPDGQHNHVNTRQELRDYEKPLYDVVDDVFRGAAWRWTPC